MIGVRTATGRIVDLLDLPADIDIVREVGEPLARIKRFGRAERGVRGAGTASRWGDS